MPRVKGGVITRHRHKKVLALTKGQRATKSKLYRRAHEAMLKSLSYSFRDRKDRKGDFRQLWIVRINAACRANGLSYSSFIAGLKKAGVEVNRKMLAELALHDVSVFARLVEMAKGSQVTTLA